MVLSSYSLFPRRALLALLLGAAGCSALFEESGPTNTVQAFASAVHESHWKAAAAQCSDTLVWSYYGDQNRVYTLQKAAAANGFLNSIQSIGNRDGFYLDTTSVSANETTAVVLGTVRIPVCYSRMELRFGKVQVAVQLKLAKLQDQWKITSIRELAPRQKE